MDNATCSEPDCDRPSRSEAIERCERHYRRHLQLARAETCSVEGCDLLALNRNMCRTHLERWRQTGDPGGTVRTWEPQRGKTCSVEECDRECCKRGFCGAHYDSWQATGIAPTGRIGESTSRYFGVHANLRRRLGPAREYTCIDCDEPADEWSYDHLDPDEMVDEDYTIESPYSLNLAHSAPRCSGCHRRFDSWRRDRFSPLLHG